MEQSPIKLIIADDHQVLVEGIKQILSGESRIEVVGEANNGKQVFKLLEKTETDIVLLDLQMPVMDGLQSTKKIRQLYPEIKVIVLSMYEQVVHVQKMMQAGADAYLLKNAGKKQLIESIYKVFSGDKVIDPRITQNFLLGLESDTTSSFIPNLTRREKEVLDLIAQEKTSSEIAETLFISLSTVEYHRKNLMAKFKVKNSVGLIKEALNKGIISI